MHFQFSYALYLNQRRSLLDLGISTVNSWQMECNPYLSVFDNNFHNNSIIKEKAPLFQLGCVSFLCLTGWWCQSEGGQHGKLWYSSGSRSGHFPISWMKNIFFFCCAWDSRALTSRGQAASDSSVNVEDWVQMSGTNSPLMWEGAWEVLHES